MNQKETMLQDVHNDAQRYTIDQHNLEASRKTLFDSIRSARTEANATQQEIADATIIGTNGLSRQRIAQIIKGE